MTRAQARNSINAVVSFYHEDSSGYITGRVVDLSADDSEFVIQCGQQRYVVPIEDVHEGDHEEVFIDSTSYEHRDDTLGEDELDGDETLSVDEPFDDVEE